MSGIFSKGYEPVNITRTLPDQSRIEQLRKYLCSDREYRQAAIMAGAGFSHNA